MAYDAAGYPAKDETETKGDKLSIEIELGVVTLDEDFELTEDEKQFGIVVLRALRILRDNKPVDRNERARRYAVTITELEKVWAYFHTWIIADRMRDANTKAANGTG